MAGNERRFIARQKLHCRRATRSDGAMTAVLEDASWIRLEPDPVTAAERHRDYFQGLTTFDVTLLTEHFARPIEFLEHLEQGRQ